jgi:uncharacterized protein Usg
MVSRAFLLQLDGYGLTTAEIHYRLPDRATLLQVYVWQDYDVAPSFPQLRAFLRYWEDQIEGKVHSVRVAHQHLIAQAEWRFLDGVLRIH